jgi:succinyl-CoA synthetase beta subunit
VRLHEWEGKELFREAGIAVPRGKVAHCPEEAARLAGELGGEVVVKAQVLAGGRGRAGGIRRATTPAEAGARAAELLQGRIKGCAPEGVLVEERLEIARELYLGLAVDGVEGRPAVVVSAEGGVDIEEVAARRPGAVRRAHLDPLAGMDRALAGELTEGLGTPGAAEVLLRLYQIFALNEALIAEINPLALLPDGRLAALDAVVEIDDAALFRLPRWQGRARPAPGETRVGGMTFVELEGEIGLVCSGAGLGMATMDLIARAARPANFLETGGGITRELMAQAMRLVLERPGLKGVLINIYGGINPIHEGALGVAEVMAEGVEVPVVAKALGNRQEETWAILEKAGVEVVRELETEKAVAALLARVGKGG